MNNGRNNGIPTATDSEEAEALLNSNSTRINIDSDATAQQQRPVRQQQEQPQDTSINMDVGNADIANSHNRSPLRSGDYPLQRNFLSLFSEARSQLGRQTSYPGTSIQQHRTAELPHFSGAGEVGDGAEGHTNSDTSFASMLQSPSAHVRSWRTNLNNVLSFSSAPSTEALRSLITHSGSFRYTPLSTNETSVNAGDNIHSLLNEEPHIHAAHGVIPSTAFRVNSRISRSASLREDATSPQNSVTTVSSASAPTLMPISEQIVPPSQQNNEGGFFFRQAQSNGGIPNNRNAATGTQQSDIDEDNNVISEIFVKFLSHFVRYLPFICILFVKFIHNHLLGILDLFILHVIMYSVNKSLREQVAKFSQKSYGVLLRDFCMVAALVTSRFAVATWAPDPFGLLIAPPSETVVIEVSSASKDESSVDEQSYVREVLNNFLSPLSSKQQSAATPDPLGSTVTVTKAISLGLLLYYVAVNDLVLKLLTILVKTAITMMPTDIIRHKPRARMYVLVEYLSQFYRAIAPIHQWLLYLFESYSGLAVISGILFCSFYMGAKGFELLERGKSLKKALQNFIRNMDYERKPTKEELDSAGSLCPICHDGYSNPVVLECSHIFCDDCVSTWFKREQTCPMCRAKVSEDPTWQDGSTTFFYQLC